MKTLIRLVIILFIIGTVLTMVAFANGVKIDGITEFITDDESYGTALVFESETSLDKLDIDLDTRNIEISVTTEDHIVVTYHEQERDTWILNELNGNPDVLYGEAVFVNNEGQSLGLRSEVTPHRLPALLSWREFKYGMLVCHQAFIAKRSLAPLFNLQYKLSSDIDWEIQVLKNSTNVLKSAAPICHYLMGGASVQNLQRSWKERYQVLKSHFGLLPNLINHLIIVARGLVFALKKQGKYW